MAVPETWFFRGGRRLFDALAGFLSPRTARGVRKPARVLSIPCSTGEEPYSLAIALHEKLVSLDCVRIDAADISAAHLNRTAAASFPDFSFREPGPDIRPLHFRPATAGRWELQPHLRRPVRVRQGNLTDLLFLADEQPYDLIFCRNLFIYLTPDGRKRAMATLDRLLAPDGWFCLSPSQADKLPPGRFVPEGPPEFCVFRRVVPERAVPPALLTPPTIRSPFTPTPAIRSPIPDRPELTTAVSPLETARALADCGRLADARAPCERAIVSAPASADGYALLGVVLQAEGKSDAATEAFRKALYLAPDHRESVSHLALLADRRGDTAAASGFRRRLARVSRPEGVA